MLLYGSGDACFCPCTGYNTLANSWIGFDTWQERHNSTCIGWFQKIAKRWRKFNQYDSQGVRGGAPQKIELNHSLALSLYHFIPIDQLMFGHGMF